MTQNPHNALRRSWSGSDEPATSNPTLRHTPRTAIHLLLLTIVTFLLCAGCEGLSSNTAITEGSCNGAELDQLQRTCLEFGGSFEGESAASGLDECAGQGNASGGSGRCTLEGSGRCRAVCRLDGLEQNDAGMFDDTSNTSNGATDSSLDAATPDVAQSMQTLEGDWLSQGDDISPLLRQNGLELNRVTVTFDDQGNYAGLIVLEDSDEQFPFAGTYELDNRTNPMGLVLRQSEPQSLISQGIVAIESVGGGVLMRYEVVQVDPPTPGLQPPTSQGGFGSTVGVQNPEDNIQIYRPF